MTFKLKLLFDFNVFIHTMQQNIHKSLVKSKPVLKIKCNNTRQVGTWDKSQRCETLLKLFDFIVTMGLLLPVVLT